MRIMLLLQEENENNDDINVDGKDKSGKVDIPGDVRELAGVSVFGIVINSKGEQVPAAEYNPGGTVYFTVQVLLPG